jgi:hypothetical protein
VENSNKTPGEQARAILLEAIKLNVAAIAGTKKVPICQLIKDFLIYHRLPMGAVLVPLGRGLTHEMWKELNERTTRFYVSIELERVNLHFKYRVKNADDLPQDKRALFDADLRAHIEREDHYP